MSGSGGVGLLPKVLVPLAVAVAVVTVWAVWVKVFAVPHYILPSPGRVLGALIADWGILWPALLVTLRTTFAALGLAIIGGVGLALVIARSRWVELSLSPYLVILQVTPVVAVAPLILVYAPNTPTALLIVAWLVAFFPILASSLQGLKSADHKLIELFELHNGSRWDQLLLLRAPSALPYFLSGLRIAGGLSLIAAVVAEFAAGSAGAGSGLAFRILEAQYRLNIPRLFAALVLLSIAGVAIYAATSLISHLALRRWHESALRREN